MVTPADREGVRDWGGRRSHRLANRILRLSHGEFTRVDFLREFCSLLLRHADADVVELWMDENGGCARCRVEMGEGGEFRFGLVPCGRRELSRAKETDLVLCEIARRLSASREGADPASCSIPGRGAGGRPILDLDPVDPVCASTVLLPLTMGEEAVGWLLLGSRGQRGFGVDDPVAFEHLAQSCSIALVNQRAQAALRKRVKELTSLYRLAQLADQPGVPVEELLNSIVHLLPAAWQYPEITVGRIVLDGRCFSSAETDDGPCRQRAPLVMGGEQRGYVEVFYREQRPTLDEGPFLNEERSLLDTIARDLAGVIERRQAAEESERLQHQLLHADRLATIGQLAAGVAHELNEPLGAVLGFSQLARKESGVPAGTTRDLEKIESAALHARDIVRELLIFARQEPPHTSEVDLNRVINNALSFLEARCVKGNIVVERRLAKSLPDLAADLSQIQQVLVNLIVNAIQAMPDGGRLLLTTGEDDGQAVLRVADTGVGISEEERGKVFLPFFTTKDVGHGTGLGLSVVHGIITAHGGAIRVESSPGVGSTFEVRLPLRAEIQKEELDARA